MTMSADPSPTGLISHSGTRNRISHGSLSFFRGPPLKPFHQLRRLDGDGHGQIPWPVKGLPVSDTMCKSGLTLAAQTICRVMLGNDGGGGTADGQGWTGPATNLAYGRPNGSSTIQ